MNTARLLVPIFTLQDFLYLLLDFLLAGFSLLKGCLTSGATMFHAELVCAHPPGVYNCADKFLQPTVILLRQRIQRKLHWDECTFPYEPAEGNLKVTVPKIEPAAYPHDRAVFTADVVLGVSAC